jgi:hypothetical protein
MPVTPKHVCDPTVPACTCGRRWECASTWSDGSVTYTSRAVRDRYAALYGEPGPGQLEPVGSAA